MFLEKHQLYLEREQLLANIRWLDNQVQKVASRAMCIRGANVVD